VLSCLCCVCRHHFLDLLRRAACRRMRARHRGRRRDTADFAPDMSTATHASIRHKTPIRCIVHQQALHPRRGHGLDDCGAEAPPRVHAGACSYACSIADDAVGHGVNKQCPHDPPPTPRNISSVIGAVRGRAHVTQPRFVPGPTGLAQPSKSVRGSPCVYQVPRPVYLVPIMAVCASCGSAIDGIRWEARGSAGVYIGLVQPVRMYRGHASISHWYARFLLSSSCIAHGDGLVFCASMLEYATPCQCTLEFLESPATADARRWVPTCEACMCSVLGVACVHGSVR
jgi:hypothetical protein